MLDRIDINQGRLDDAVVLAVSGDVDLSNVNYFVERLMEASANGDAKIVLDISAVEFVDSTVVNALFATAPRIRAYGGDMAIVVGDTAAGRVLRMSGVDMIYRVTPTRAEALERLHGVIRARPA